MLAVAGVAGVLCIEAVRSVPLESRQEVGLIVPAFGIPLVFVALALGMSEACRTLLRHPDLLVPLGIVTLAEAAVGWLALLPAVGALLAPTRPLQIATLTFTLSAAVVLLIAVQVAYGAWTTTLVRSVVIEDQSDPLRAAADCRRWLLRVFCLEAIGWVVLFGGVALAVALAAVSIVITLLAIGIGALLWNLTTAALLPVALDDRLSFWEALVVGIRASWATKARWWKPVVLQMILLGWVTLALSINHTKWSVNGFWTGGYETSCRWYSDEMKVVDAPAVPVVSSLLGLLFGVLAIAVKLTVAEGVGMRPFWPEEEGDVFATPLDPAGEWPPGTKRGAGRGLLFLFVVLFLTAGVFLGGWFIRSGGSRQLLGSPAYCMGNTNRSGLPDPRAQEKLHDYVRSQDFILTILKRKPKYAPLIPEAPNFWHPSIVGRSIDNNNVATNLDSSYQPLFMDLRDDIYAELSYLEGSWFVKQNDVDQLIRGCSYLDRARGENPALDLRVPLQEALAQHGQDGPVRAMLQAALAAAEQGNSLKAAAERAQ